jgi:hypothetical protein
MKNNPYIYAFIKLLASVEPCLKVLKLGRQRLDFIFDNRKIEEKPLIEGWFDAKEHIIPEYPKLFKKILVNTPQFRGSRELIALQSADFLAGSQRAANIALRNGRQPNPLWKLHPDVLRVFALPTNDEMLADAAREGQS